MKWNLLFVVSVFLGGPNFAFADDRPAVDVLLVLATDVSDSIAPASYRLELEGLKLAFRDPELAYILEKCNGEGVGITYVEWGGSNNEGLARSKQRVPWRRLRTGADLSAFAKEIETFNARDAKGNTDILSALRFSANLIEQAPFQSGRKIISLSSDGIQNEGEGGNWDFDRVIEEPILRRQLRAGSSALIDQGIVINALVLLTDPMVKMSLPEYFQEYVVGGPGAQVLPVESIEGFAQGFKAKLKRELDNCAM